MRGKTADSAASPSPTTSMSFRGISVISLRRHQVASLEPSSEEELQLLDLFHTHLTDSLQSLLPSPDSKTPYPSLILTLPFLHKLLDILLTSESDFKSLLLVLSRNPRLISRPSLDRNATDLLDRAATDLLDRAVKSLDLYNSVSLSLHSLRLWNRHAQIAASALHHSSLPQINRARRALSKLLSASTGLSSSSSSCLLMSRISSAKRHLRTSLSATSCGDSGSVSVLVLAFHTISTFMYFIMWVMVASFRCGGREMEPPPSVPAAVRHMPWATALALLHERIGEEINRERKEGGLVAAAAGMLSETVALERNGREVLKMVINGERTEAAAAELASASRKLEEGLGPFERKVREVFHRLVRCREEVLRCLSDGSSSSVSSMDSE